MLTENRDLRGGRPCWRGAEKPPIKSDPLPEARVDVAIVGAGIMGASIAERLSRDGVRVALVDRRPPAHGSTAASTALVMWEMDVPLTHLAGEIGMAEAARRWRRVHKAVRGIDATVATLDADCGWIARPILYRAGTLLDPEALAAESRARAEAGLPSEILAAEAVAARFDIAPRDAILSGDAWEVNPVALTEALLRKAQARGASIHHPVDVVALEEGADAVTLRLEDGGTIDADTAIIAGGYERAPLLLPPPFEIVSSYAIATAPGTAPLWRENAMIWEASDPYLYARATADGRVIAGGEDEDFADAAQRDALIEAKSGVIAAKLAAMIGVENVAVDCAWAAAFGSSPDGLPAIGRAANHARVILANGFGGNGVSFAALAAEIVAAELAGAPDPDADCFSPYRFS
ncbi:Glycine/D-amino acid oxidase [Allosphingosinicella indica]|uniref:Glycine/D-amino acid oxidase n=1 Tax=Allosphingosinicella indica TaxID=941907 RepID=A0A1X7GH14_9SPHN|nr:Glycine/D-amino acid oxidase [Allosphingosinicella indica]